MPIINPTLHQFVVSPQTYRRAGIVPPGWLEIEPASRISNYHGLLSLDYPKISYTKVPVLVETSNSKENENTNDKEGKAGAGAGKEGGKGVGGWREHLPWRLLGIGGGATQQEKLLTITIPAADFRLWWINRWQCFEPPAAVKVIVFQADGYRLRRIESETKEVGDVLEQPSIDPNLPIITITPPREKNKTCEDIPVLNPELLVPPTPRWVKRTLPDRLPALPQRKGGLVRPTTPHPHNQTVGVSHIPRLPPRLPKLRPLDNVHPIKTRDIPFIPLDEEELRRDSLLRMSEPFWFGKGEFVWLKPAIANTQDRRP